MRVRGISIWTALALGLTLSTACNVNAQKPGAAQPTSQPPTNRPDDTLNSTQPDEQPVQQQPSKQETKALKAFRDVQPNEADKKTQLAEDFIQNYPKSQNRPEVVLWLSRAYLVKGDVAKLQAEGDKELALTPSNPLSLAVLGSNLSRAVTPSTPDSQKYLTQAQLYCKTALDDLEKMKKPANLSDDKFTQAKNETAATAYSGLGTVAFRNQKYNDAITNLDQAVKLGGSADPVNYYLLGKANEAATNFDQALAAYTKCAAAPGAMQAPCQQGATDVKAHGAVLPK
jgi:tetratricopeptide (TPR) repeat protein